MAGTSNKTAVITGAAGGLGRALAIEFFNRGYNLALIDKDAEGLLRIQNEFRSGPQMVTIHPADISKEEQVVSTHISIVMQHALINVLVNNAAVSISQPFEQLDLSDYKTLFDVNFWGAVYCTKHFLPDLKKQPHSKLVNIISDFALLGFPGKTSYGSSKSAVMGFSNALKTELSESFVKVCLVIPPPLNTGIVANGKHIDAGKQKREALFLEKNGMPLEKAAARIVTQLEEGKFRIVIGPMMFWIDLASRLFPTLVHRMVARLKKRIDFI